MLIFKKPTPVSALIHAATMVTAGIFLMIRVCYLIELAPNVQKLILLLGGMTALFAGSIGTVQMDLKKVIAYSTCSQLGFMSVACGLGAYDVALFHLAMHAFFKALLFLSAGSIIHAFFYDEQDIRRIGGAFKILPVTYTAFFIGSLALAGFPYLSGYYSKDTILELLLVVNCPISQFSLVCCFLAVMCTTFYSVRLLYFVFFSKSRTTKSVLNHSHESSYYILIPLILLSLLSLCAGFLLKDSMINLSFLSSDYRSGLTASYLLYDSFTGYNNYYLIEELSSLLKLMSFVIVLVVTVSTVLFYENKQFRDFIYRRLMETDKFLFLYRFLEKKWYFDIVYAYFSRFILSLSYYNLMIFWERGFLEYFGPYGLVLVTRPLSDFVRNFQSGSSVVYFGFFYLVVVIFICFSFNFFFFGEMVHELLGYDLVKNVYSIDNVYATSEATEGLIKESLFRDELV